MNERIRELLKQSCGFEYDEAGKELTPILVGKDLAKFAQLIVRECADIAREIGNNTEPDDFALDRCYEIEDQIKQHFGVEE